MTGDGSKHGENWGPSGDVGERGNSGMFNRGGMWMWNFIKTWSRPLLGNLEIIVHLKAVLGYQ
jgi:hypothetical protein